VRTECSEGVKFKVCPLLSETCRALKCLIALRADFRAGAVRGSYPQGTESAAPTAAS